MKDFYAYLYYDHRNGHVPVYVGKGHGRRAFDHLKPSKNYHIGNLLGRMLADGISVFVGIINCPDEEFAFLLEQELIARYGRRDRGSGSLLNLTDGGEGESGRAITDEQRAKLVRAHTGYKWTPEAIAKRTASQKGIKRSEETKAKMAAAQRARFSKFPRKGHKHSPEACAKISASKMGKKRPPITDEARQNLSASGKAAWAPGGARRSSCRM